MKQTKTKQNCIWMAESVSLLTSRVVCCAAFDNVMIGEHCWAALVAVDESRVVGKAGLLEKQGCWKSLMCFPFDE